MAELTAREVFQQIKRKQKVVIIIEGLAVLALVPIVLAATGNL
jgi:hypothetical protein